MTSAFETREDKVDLTNCDREPIHIPGAIQAHGVLVVVREPELIVEQISENTDVFFDRPAKHVLGKPLSDLLAPEDLRYLTDAVLPQPLEANPHYLTPMRIGTQTFEVIAHRFKGKLLLEFELPPDDVHTTSLNTYAMLRAKFNELNRIYSLQHYCQRAAEVVREFIGFDRVMVYRFFEDGAGHVMAEANRADLEPYLGMHFPASDIPQQARALYKLNPVRLLPDVDAQRVPLVGLDSAANEPLDMSHTSIRAMSPIHLEYLRNMGVRSSMSLSIMHDDKLWGLFACHHYTPHYVSHAARAAAEFMAHLLSLQVGAKEDADNHAYTTRLKNAHTGLIDQIGGANLLDGLFNKDYTLLSEMDAEGAALIYGDDIRTMGRTPNLEQLRELTVWLNEHQPQEIFATTCLSRDFPAAEAYRDRAAGLLVACMMRNKPEYLMWFRPEQARLVNWAGNPNKPVTVGEFGDRLTPRKSFALWQESVNSQSKPWLKYEIDHATKLRYSLVEVILRQTEKLVMINKELEQSNIELDAFAYVASHDLKEPLRGIHNYAHFLLEDYGDKLDETGKEQLKTLTRLTERMESLLDSLLYYSRLGRTNLNLTDVNTQAVLDDTLELLQGRIEESAVQIRVMRPLPAMQADKLQLSEVFLNLIANAIKYNDKTKKQIEIGSFQQDGPPVIYVKDNGIGIDRHHHDNIFRIFRRLHGRNAFGGGVGAGLTIVKKIVERHGGRIWLESTPGDGTTFYFTLSPPSA